MNKKVLGFGIVALLLFAPLVWADDTVDAGWQMDPNGLNLDGDCSPGIDPNGAGSSMDPNGC